jgi:hypothetical protein
LDIQSRPGLRRLAILITGSTNEAFYSQIAAVRLAVARLPWRRWQPVLYACLGGPPPSSEDDEAWHRWAPHLDGIRVHIASPDDYRRKENWAQVDAALERAPDDADVLMSLDADTLPVAGFEDVLDQVAADDVIAGVIAHYPPPPGDDPRAEWLRAADGILTRPLAYPYTYSLIEPGAGGEAAAAPFYVNGGVVFYGRGCFDRFVPLYLDIRARLARRLPFEAFSGQIATTLAIAESGVQTWALPIRYNFPNDPIARRLYPDDAANVVIHHYLRTTRFDRHRIFASAAAFEEFMAMPLDGVDASFRTDVSRIFSARYPFG